MDRAYEESENGKMPKYAAIQEMEYLDMVIHETLRRFNPLAIITRRDVLNMVYMGQKGWYLQDDHSACVDLVTALLAADGPQL